MILVLNLARLRRSLSWTEPSELDLSENDERKRPDPELLKPTSGCDVSSVLFHWGEAKDNLGDILTEYEDLFMNNKYDTGTCNIAKHRIASPETIPHREGKAHVSRQSGHSTPRSAEFFSSRFDSTLLLAMGQWDCHGEEEK